MLDLTLVFIVMVLAWLLLASIARRTSEQDSWFELAFSLVAALGSLICMAVWLVDAGFIIVRFIGMLR